ncbi:MAG: DUF2586 family protein [Urechidicola sp.]|nr:DUF2586 family protein [Urechidicola sp.]
MATLDGVKINRGKIGANTLAIGDSFSGLIAAAVATSSLALGTVTTIYNIVDAENLGIDAAYDSDNDVTVFRHISEFYRMAGEGTKLYLLLVPQATTMTDICDDAGEVFAKKMLNEAEGDIRQLAVSVNPTGATVQLNGIPDDVYNAIPKAQALYDWAADRFMPLNIVLEGYDYGGDSATVADLRAIAGVNATNVSVVIGQDYDYAETLNGNAQKFAEVGTALGTVAKADVNQNIGDNEAFNLTNAFRGIWIVAGLSNHVAIKTVKSSLQTLEDKGFIFGVTYNGLDGVRWNNDHTCTEVIIDNEGNINEHTIAYGRTHDKARRVLRTALLPKVKTKQPVNPKTGKLPIGVIKYFENLGDTVLGDMETRREISVGKTTVDPDSDLITEKLLKVKFRIVPYGNVNAIEGTSNLKNSL